MTESKPKYREFYVENKLRRGINEAFDPDNVEGPIVGLYTHVIEIEALRDLEAKCAKLVAYLEVIENCRRVKDMVKFSQEALAEYRGEGKE